MIKNFLVAKFLLKADDDSFINVPNLIQILLGGTIPIYKSAIYTLDAKSPLKDENLVKNTENLLLGVLYPDSTVTRRTDDRFYVPEFMYEGKVYPPYLEGSAYVMSSDVALKLYDASFKTPILHFEDVFITGLAAKNAEVTPTHHPAMRLVYETEDFCSFHGVICQHKVSEETMYKAFEFLTDFDNNCEVYSSNSIFRRLHAVVSGKFLAVKKSSN